ncbi:MAG: hypothetical protein RSD02_01805 [Niameybacter sp.]
MKDLIEKLSSSLKNTCKEALDQTQKTVDQAKYRSDFLTLKNELKKLYQKLGEAYYKKHIEGEKAIAPEAICNRITSLIHEIDKMEKEVEDTVYVQKDSFDAYKREVRQTWNENQPTYASVKRDENGIKILRFCPHCNVGNPTKAMYCIHCGEKL